MTQYLDKYGYVVPNYDFLEWVIRDLASSLCRTESINNARKEFAKDNNSILETGPKLIVFPDEFADYIENSDFYEDLKRRFLNSFDNHDLISEANIIGLFGEVRLIKWLWIHKLDFNIIKTGSSPTPDFIVKDRQIELYTPMLDQYIFEQTTKLERVDNNFGAANRVDYDYKTIFLKVATQINKKINKQLSDSADAVLICNLDFRIFYKHDLTLEQIRANLEKLYDQIITPVSPDLDKQTIVGWAWQCWKFKKTETLFSQPLSVQNQAIITLLEEYYRYTANNESNMLYMHFEEIKSVLVGLKLLNNTGKRNLIFTEGYDDTSILVNNGKVNKTSLLKFLSNTS